MNISKTLTFLLLIVPGSVMLKQLIYSIDKEWLPTIILRSFQFYKKAGKWLPCGDIFCHN